MMRSPPPPVSQQPQPQHQQHGYNNPYQPNPAQGGGQFAPGFGGFMSDPTAQMGFQVGKSAVMAGQEYMEQNVCPLFCFLFGYISSHFMLRHEILTDII